MTRRAACRTRYTLGIPLLMGELVEGMGTRGASDGPDKAGWETAGCDLMMDGLDQASQTALHLAWSARTADFTGRVGNRPHPRDSLN